MEDRVGILRGEGEVGSFGEKVLDKRVLGPVGNGGGLVLGGGVVTEESLANSIDLTQSASGRLDAFNKEEGKGKEVPP